ncbi:MAG: hypothetical protein EZS28_021364 [Streblomastix strix]|uniref:SPRY domain-containing protein n=1 Tax=Streblomastix strix TaxID=222440 RepID=A0A5J4VL92_9EUKA|nr:MAG: hypothetical protein EZS28_021364 [Streblomastix strix]
MSESAQDQEIQELKKKLKEVEEQREQEKNQREREKRRANFAEDENHRLLAEVERLRAQLAQRNQESAIAQIQTRSSPSPQPHRSHSPPSIPTVPLNLSITSLTPIIPNQDVVRWTENKLIHTADNNDLSTVLFNPIISSGIVRFEGFYDSDAKTQHVGIADTSVVYSPGCWPDTDENDKKSVLYDSSGDISHIQNNIQYGNMYIRGNGKFEPNKRIACEVNMTSTPKRLHFFVNGEQQPISVVNIPSQIRFLVFLQAKNLTFTVTRFESLPISSVKQVRGQKAFEYGKKWLSDDYDKSLSSSESENDEQYYINFVEGVTVQTDGIYSTHESIQLELDQLITKDELLPLALLDTMEIVLKMLPFNLVQINQVFQFLIIVKSKVVMVVN